ncbi:Acetamidase [Cyberlindnera fabianii]|uniref:amidase n=1 Tax=Cyberlindnera fabianii TaxID=36022 RepID=A0A1V2L2U1_CYBFA|nr:Acetamidase [Cyberlindnera fabianii]
MTVANLAKFPSIDHSKEDQWAASATTFKPNPELFEEKWAGKIKAYNDTLEAAIPKEYLAPADLVPKDLDSGHFNATLIPPKVLDPETLAITELTAVEIVSKIASGELTSVAVLTAFIKRCTIAHQLTHCAMEILFDEGLKRAAELDDHFTKTGKTIGPLHGLPISLKEQHDYAGHITHRGYVALLDNIPDAMAITPQILYEQGAVFYVRTTEPQSLMHPDSVNFITGRGRNAVKTSMSPGGSSSGEGSIIAMKGSPIGLGSDIGGSIRFPAAFNGVWGIKPTSLRLSGVGSSGAAETTVNFGVMPTVGPLANSVEDLELFMKVYADSKPWLKDQSLAAIPWREIPEPKPSDLTIALVFDDGVVKPHPPNIRAMAEAEKKLKAAGFNVITWEPHRVHEAVEITNSLFSADGNLAAKLKFAESGEPLAPLTEYFLSVGRGDEGLNMLEYMTYIKDREVLRQQYLTLFNERKVDFILTPTYVGVAPKPHTPKYWGYTSLWNILDASCVTLPSGLFADKTIDLRDDTYKPRNKYEEYEYGLYDAEYADGLPIGLTVVGRRYTEEECLKASKVIHGALTA